MQTKKYVTIAKDLPVNGSVKTLCDDKCGITKSQSVRHTPHGYHRRCYRCGATEFTRAEERTLDQIFKKYPTKKLGESTAETHVRVRDSGDYDAIIWLYSHGITDAIQERHGIMYCTKYKRVYLPVYDVLTKQLNGYLLRGFSTDKRVPKYISFSLTQDDLYWVQHYVDNAVVVLVEDIISAIKIAESGANVSVMATLGTENIFRKFMRSSLGLVRPWESRRIALLAWFDNDAAGKKAEKQVDKYRSILRTMFKGIDFLASEEDPKKYTAQEICTIIHSATQDAVQAQMRDERKEGT